MTEDNPSIMHHVSIASRNIEASLTFYDGVLATIGAKRVFEEGGAVAYGKAFPEFWVASSPYDGGKAETANGTHFAFFAASTDEVDAFHAKAVELGGMDDGKPGYRPEYGPPYYGCFIRDPDGHKIEATFWDESKA